MSVLLSNGKVIQSEIYLVKKPNSVTASSLEDLTWMNSLCYNIGGNMFPEKKSNDLHIEMCYLLGCLSSPSTVIVLTYNQDEVRITLTNDTDVPRLIKILESLMIKYSKDNECIIFKLGVWAEYFRVDLEALKHKVPEKIMKGPKACAIAFLQGFFGTEFGNKSTKSCSNEIQAQQLHILLTNLGYDAVIHSLQISIISDAQPLCLKIVPIKKIYLK